MRKLSALFVVVVGISQSGCGDESSGPALGPDTTWQIGCAPGSTVCGSIMGASVHGPVGGTDAESSRDDEKIKVSCSTTSAGLQIVITDPGREMSDPKFAAAKARAPSTLTIANADPDNNKCNVNVVEETLGSSGSTYVLNENCKGNKSGNAPANCTFTGQKNSNGYDFEGELQCPGMHYMNTTTADYRLGAGKDPSSPIKLQIVHCSF